MGKRFFAWNIRSYSTVIITKKNRKLQCENADKIRFVTVVKKLRLHSEYHLIKIMIRRTSEGVTQYIMSQYSKCSYIINTKTLPLSF